MIQKKEQEQPLKTESLEDVAPIITVKNLAEYLSVSESTIYQWVKEQKIPHYRIDKTIRFSQPVIERWLAYKFQPEKQPDQPRVEVDIDKLLMSTRIGTKV
ncbi:helix-turn-helix domain-containing protein [candidate division WOR-3 bacterium]|nr:helix-turn-helix domain-containing protein [candidate division WOR-3 bacterium]